MGLAFSISLSIFSFLYWRSKVAFTVIKTAIGINLLVLQDKNYLEIISQIFTARNEYLRENYLEIDFENEAEAEVNKFAWLKEQGIISDKEFIVIREAIEDW